MRATIVYEDQGAASGRFVPHEVVLHTALLRQGVPLAKRFAAAKGAEERVNRVPVKGNGNILNWLAKNGDRVRRHGPIAVVFDHDEVRRLFHLPESVDRQALVAAIQAKCSADPEVFFFVENMESIVARAATLLHKPVPTKSLAARDQVLQALLASDAALRGLYATTEIGFYEVVDFAARSLAPSQAPT